MEGCSAAVLMIHAEEASMLMLLATVRKPSKVDSAIQRQKGAASRSRCVIGLWRRAGEDEGVAVMGEFSGQKLRHRCHRFYRILRV